MTEQPNVAERAVSLGYGDKNTVRNLAQAQAKSRKALAERGGRMVQVRLEADAAAALDDIRRALGLRYDRDAVVHALLLVGEDIRAGRVRPLRETTRPTAP